MKPPKEVANLVIQAIRNNDLNLMVSLFNAVNRKRFLPPTEEKIKIMSRLREGELKKIADVTGVEEIREAPSHIQYDSVIAKVNQIGDDVHVIVLSKEENGYFFEDFNSLHIEEYQKLKKLDV